MELVLADEEGVEVTFTIDVGFGLATSALGAVFDFGVGVDPLSEGVGYPFGV